LRLKRLRQANRRGPAFPLTGLLTIALFLAMQTAATAGGYMAVDNTGQPYKWSGPITLHLDLGPLGKLSKAEADDLTMSAAQTWMSPSLPGSTVQFVRGSDLSEDYGDGNDTGSEYDLDPPRDGKTSIIYDQNGILIEQLGAGASQSVVGVTGVILPDDLSPAPITEAIMIMNGKMISGSGGTWGSVDLPLDQFKGAIIHEFGHMLGLGHSQASIAFIETGYEIDSVLPGWDPDRFPPDYRGMPTMFPAVLPGLDSLAMDDIAWIKSLYGDAGHATLGNIHGTIKTTSGSPFDGANVVAYHADDPTSLVTCVSGYADAFPTTAPTGTYRIPGLDPGSKWIIDVEPVVAAFTGGSRVGPIDPPAELPGAPEFVNEPGVESATDQASLSTTFAIPTAGTNRDIHDANLQFNDINDYDTVAEIDTGTDEHTGQIVPVTPGRFTMINGHLDPNEPGMQDVYVYGKFGDFYRVKQPAGVELNQLAVISHGSPLSSVILDLKDGEDSVPVTATSGLFGSDSLSLFMDSSRVSYGSYNGTFSFGVGYAYDILGGGTTNYQPTDYTLALLFSVSDRDSLALSGTASGEIDADSSSVFRIKGRGFKNIGGPPAVTFDPPTLAATSVTFIDEKNLDVAVAKQGGFTPGPMTLQVMNRPESGGYGGRILQNVTGLQSKVTGWELY